MAQTNEPGSSAEEMARRTEEMARRQAEAGERATAEAAETAGRAGTQASEQMREAFDGGLVEAQKEMFSLVYRTMSEQAQQNIEFMLDLSGTRGVERMMKSPNQYLSDTMARAQRFQTEMLSLTQHTAEERRVVVR